MGRVANDPAVRWLLRSKDPSVRFLTLTEIVGKKEDSPDAIAARRQILRGPRVRALLSGQRTDGGFGVHPYTKWVGAHWRLVSLVELAIQPREPRAVNAANEVLSWLTGPTHRGRIKVVNGLTRRCASQEGNALAVCSRLGLAEDPRVEVLAESLASWQWPDGGWNCRKDVDAHHSSFHETLPPLWGLLEYRRASGDGEALKAAERAAECLLRHRLFRSERTGEVIHPKWLQLHYPPYWHYDILQSLLVLSRMGPLRDARLGEALDVIEAKRSPDGMWRADGYHWRPGTGGTYRDAADWGRGPNEMITLNALRVLHAAGRLT